MRQLLIFSIAIVFSFTSCDEKKENKEENKEPKVENTEYVKTTPEWAKDKNIYEVNIRQFTEEGTFKAFEEHLPRLKEMGVDILWFMPVSPIGELNRKGTKGSYYSITDYTAINPEFGTLEDFKALVKKTHDMEMYVLIDWVANHTAWDHPWTKSNPEFFTKDSAGNFVPPVDDWSDVIDLNYDNKELWIAMTDALKFWIEEVDIDGFRCDVADMVPTEFWNQAREELDKIKPVFMLAEAETPELHDKAFDMTYGWRLMHVMNQIAKGEKNVSELDTVMIWEEEAFPEGSYRMRFTTNHDENSWNGTVFERYGDGAKTYAVLCATLPGMPLIYSGQESAMDKRLEFFEKDLIEWKDYEYKEFYTKLLKLKKDNPALWNGEFGGAFERIDTKGHDSVYAFKRVSEENQLVVILNFSDQDTEVDLEIDIPETTEALSGETFTCSKDNPITLAAWEYKVIVL